VHGSRNIPKSEIDAAVAKAFEPSADLSFRNTTPRPRLDGVKLLNAIVECGAGFDKAGLREASPVRINWSAECDAIEVLQRLYAPTDHLFIGARQNNSARQVLPVWEWIERFEGGLTIPEFVIPNPLTGDRGRTRDGKPSFRADSCVAHFKYAVVEFDGISLEQQIRFWAGVPLPIVALVSSGGKSVHGWVRIDAFDADDWTRRVERKLFDLLAAVGADAACKNEGRLSRMPGHFRAYTNKWQRLLYLNPVGGPIIR
jgi:hypothetical protein